MEKVCGYLIEERLGRGGMSVVYKALAPITNRVVALKMLHPRDDIFVDLVGEDRLRKIFIEEARIMGGIHHENVAKVIACHEDGEAPIIVLEYFSHSLGSIIGDSTRVKTSRVISVNLACQYICQTLRGLERIHIAGIIHRDIKPHNLMIDEDDRVKIIDFGLCTVRKVEKMALPGMKVGSPYYTAPEQDLNPRRADERSDLFSVGAIAYRLLTGRLVNHNEASILLPSMLNNGLNEDWDEFLLKSIHPNARDRYQSAYGMRQHLEKIYGRWVKQSDKKHRLATSAQAKPRENSMTLRIKPCVLGSEELQELLNLDSLMRPTSYFPYRFELVGTTLLKCHDTRLMWQREGAGFQLNWNKASEYIQYLNYNEWQGYCCWRLPTVIELGTLLHNLGRMRGFCFGSHLSEEIHWVWSCDVSSEKEAWVVDVLERYFQEMDKDGMASVCAVATTA